MQIGGKVTSPHLFYLSVLPIRFPTFQAGGKGGGAKKEEDENRIFHFNIRHFVHSNALNKIFG